MIMKKFYLLYPQLHRRGFELLLVTIIGSHVVGIIWFKNTLRKRWLRAIAS